MFEQQVARLECDSQSAIFLEKNPSYHSKIKHIDVQYLFIKEMVENGKVLLENVDIVENIAYLLTKSVSLEKFTWCRSGMGLIALSNSMVISVSPKTCIENNKWDNFEVLSSL